jgi:hypothetical protein
MPRRVLRGVAPTELYAPWDVDEVFTSSTLNSQLTTLSLLNHFLKLLTDYGSVEAISFALRNQVKDQAKCADDLRLRPILRARERPIWR